MIGNKPEKRPEEASFTLLEVIIAVGLLTAVVIQMATGQGTIFGMVDYGQRSTQAVWLAKRIMSQVEYNYHNVELKDMEIAVKDQVFRDVPSDFEYQWSLEIQEWKLPIFDLLAGGGPKKEGEEDDSSSEEKPQNTGSQALAGFEDAINKVFEGHILKTARVDVSWPDGARRSSISLTYLLTNQKKLDEYLTLKKGVWEGILKQSTPGQTPVTPNGSGGQNPTPTPNPTATPGGGGTPPPPTPTPAPVGDGSTGDEGGGGF